MLVDRDDVAPIIQPMLIAWRQQRQQITTFDEAVRILVKSSPACRHLIGVPGIGLPLCSPMSAWSRILHALTGHDRSVHTSG